MGTRPYHARPLPRPPPMTPLTTFALAFVLTLAALVVTLVTGLRWRVKRRRAVHIGSVAVALGCFGWTIAAAYRVGTLYDLPAAGWIYPVHMFLARVATLCLLLPTISGIAILLGDGGHARHRKLAFFAFGMVVLAAVTGAWMLSAAPRIDVLAG